MRRGYPYLITGPTLLVVVPHDVLVVRIWVFSEITLNQILRILCIKPQQHINTINVTCVQSDGVSCLRLDVFEGQILIGDFRGPRNFRGPCQAQQQQIQDQSVVLEGKRGELQATDKAIGVGMHHVFERKHDVVFGRHVVGNVVVDDQTEQTIEQREIHLLVDTFEGCLQQDDALATIGAPHIVQVVDTWRDRVQ